MSGEAFYWSTILVLLSLVWTDFIVDECIIGMRLQCCCIWIRLLSTCDKLSKNITLKCQNTAICVFYLSSLEFTFYDGQAPCPSSEYFHLIMVEAKDENIGQYIHNARLCVCIMDDTDKQERLSGNRNQHVQSAEIMQQVIDRIRPEESGYITYVCNLLDIKVVFVS